MDSESVSKKSINRIRRAGVRLRAASVLILFSAAGAFAQAKPGWNLVWSDEFDGPTLDTKKWNVTNEASNVNSELEFYSNSQNNLFIDSGSLVLRARKENVGGRNYTSGKVTTQNKGDWLYGLVEVRAKLNSGKGMWPAIWMMPTDNAYGGWPASGEMDIMELLGHEPNKVYGTIHWSNGGHQQQGSSKTLSSGTFADDYHVFGYEWSAGHQSWLIDGVSYFTTARGQPFDKRFYLILNVAVGGGWPGNPDGTTPFPNDMRVDWVRIYTPNGNSSVDAQALAPGMKFPAASFQDQTRFENGEGESRIRLTDLSGRLVWEKRAGPHAGVDFGRELHAGVYVFQAVSGGKSHSMRLAKTR